MAEAHFRFYEELNDFLPVDRRRQEFRVFFDDSASVKLLIEALGVPHTKVEIVLVNDEAVDFGRQVRDGDRVSAYPIFELLDVSSLVRVRDRPLRDTRFAADAHLGGLARRLRMAGFDTLLARQEDDAELVRLAVAEGRIVLTRDLELLKHRELTHGLYVRALKPRDQLREVFVRLDLAPSCRPFTRCMGCNAPVRDVGKDATGTQGPPSAARERQARFAECAGCGRVCWEGPYWRHIQAELDSLSVR